MARSANSAIASSPARARRRPPLPRVRPTLHVRCAAVTSHLYVVSCQYEGATRVVHLRLDQPDDADAQGRATAGRVRLLLYHLLRRWLPRDAEAAAADRVLSLGLQAACAALRLPPASYPGHRSGGARRSLRPRGDVLGSAHARKYPPLSDRPRPGRDDRPRGTLLSHLEAVPLVPPVARRNGRLRLEQRVHDVLRRERGIQATVRLEGGEPRQDRRDGDSELRRLPAVSRQHVSPPGLRARVHVGHSRNVWTRGPQGAHPEGPSNRERPEADLQAAPERAGRP